MKPQLLLSAVAVLTYAGSLLAQPTLNFSGMPPFGATLSSSEVDGTGITPGASGANQTWDFSAYPDTGMITNIQFADAASTPYAAQFPSANSVSVGTANFQGGAIMAYTFTNLSSSGLELVGNVISFGPGFESITPLTNPQTIYSFPAGFNSVSNDEFAILSTSFTLPPAPPSENLITGTASYLVDGYGTLITSSGTYPNCLRFKRREITSDTIISIGLEGQFSISYNVSRNTTYEWVNVEDNGSFPVWTIAYDTSSTTQQFGQAFENYSSSVNHSYGDIPTRLQESNATKLGLYPNPASQQVMVMLPQDAQVSLLDLGGRVVSRQVFSLGDGAMPILDVSALPNGAYLIRAEGNNYSSIGKIVVLH